MAIDTVIRLLHPQHFSGRQQRYVSVAFRNSAGGISVIDPGCVAQTGRPICHHIAAYYPSRIRGTPPRFWRINRSELPAAHGLSQQDTESGDHCHYNITGMTNAECKSLLASKILADFEICDDDGPRPITALDPPPMG